MAKRLRPLAWRCASPRHLLVLQRTFLPMKKEFTAFGQSFDVMDIRLTSSFLYFWDWPLESWHSGRSACVFECQNANKPSNSHPILHNYWDSGLLQLIRWELGFFLYKLQKHTSIKDVVEVEKKRESGHPWWKVRVWSLPGFYIALDPQRYLNMDSPNPI